jgi:RHS repeat-associated protein
MKIKTIVAVTLTNLSLSLAYSQTYNSNFVKHQQLKVAVTNPASIPPATGNNISEVITYSDGLNRTTEVLSRRQSPNEKDFVFFSIYDNTGRQTRQYLPYSTTDVYGKYRSDPIHEQSIFYGMEAKVSHTPYPYSEIRFDNSPEDKVLETSAPGYSWKMKEVPGEGNTILISYGFNNQTDAVRKWSITGNTATTSGFYSANELTKMIRSGENRHLPQGDKQIIIFTDKSGHQILRKEISGISAQLLTYYIYDDFGNLRFIVPPKASALIPSSGNWSTNNYQGGNVDLVFYNRYDSKQRLIEKKTPGKESEYFVYDLLDHLTMRQDGNLRNNSQWYFYEYDIFGRVVDEGLISNNSQTHTDAQFFIDTLTSPVYEERNSTTSDGYSDQSFPSTSNQNQPASKYRIYYYDEYPGFVTGNYQFVQDTNFPGPISASNKGRLVSAQVRTLETTEKWLKEVYYYDKKGRIIQKIADNHLGGIDVTFNLYNFNGSIDRTLVVHNYVPPSGGATHHITYRYEYDNGGRITDIYQQVDTTQQELHMVNLKYNEIGQLIQKNLHKGVSNTKYLQSVDYAYNPKGFLTNINNANLSNINIYSQSEINLQTDELVSGMSIDSLSMRLNVYTDGNNVTNLVVRLIDAKSLRIYKSTPPDSTFFMDAPETNSKTFVDGREEDQLIFSQLSPYNDQSFTFYMNGLFFDANSDIAQILDSIETNVYDHLAGQGITDEEARVTVSHLIKQYYHQRIGMVSFNKDYDDLFGMNITYDLSPPEQYQSRQFNGNIGTVTWQINGSYLGEKRYTYEYDWNHRLHDASYSALVNKSWSNNGEDDKYSMSDLTYDENGNIITLKRKGQAEYKPQNGGPRYGEIDYLSYAYKGNRLDAVTDNDSTNTATYMPDFHEISTATTGEYIYDYNGNMVADNNKGITSIIYNFLNQPVEINFGTNCKIVYLYDAAGRKLYKKVFKNNTLLSKTGYSGDYVYQDDTLQMVLTREGRLIPNRSGGFDAQYFLKDYLGNVRVLFHENQSTHLAALIQEDNFDPFGFKLGGLDVTSDVGNKYLYQRKELQEDGVDTDNDNEPDMYLNWYDFDARYFDVQLARWHVPDPAGQGFSPYAAMGNNPVSMVDPTGMRYVWSEASYWRRINYSDDPSADHPISGHLGSVSNLYFDYADWKKDLGQSPPFDPAINWGLRQQIDDWNQAWQYDMLAAAMDRWDKAKKRAKEAAIQKQRIDQQQNDLKIIQEALAAHERGEFFGEIMKGPGMSFGGPKGKPSGQGGGYIDFAEATTNYRFGNGQPLYADANKLDWGNFSMTRFNESKITYQGYPLIYIKFDGKDYVNKTQALVYGSVGIVKISDDSFYVLPDEYNFDIKFQKNTFWRDQATNLGGLYAGPGTPFPIYFYGIVKPGR